jgi:hypothetical protein
MQNFTCVMCEGQVTIVLQWAQSKFLLWWRCGSATGTYLEPSSAFTSGIFSVKFLVFLTVRCDCPETNCKERGAELIFCVRRDPMFTRTEARYMKDIKARIIVFGRLLRNTL